MIGETYSTEGAECPYCHHLTDPADDKPAPVVTVQEAAILRAAGEEYILCHVTENEEQRMGRHSAVRGMMVRLGLYPMLEAAIIRAEKAKRAIAGGGDE